VELAEVDLVVLMAAAELQEQVTLAAVAVEMVHHLLHQELAEAVL